MQSSVPSEMRVQGGPSDSSQQSQPDPVAVEVRLTGEPSGAFAPQWVVWLGLPKHLLLPGDREDEQGDGTRLVNPPQPITQSLEAPPPSPGITWLALGFHKSR